MNSSMQTSSTPLPSGAIGELERELADVIGKQALEILLLERGGTSIWIPETVSGSQLSGIIGDIAAQSMINYFGPGKLTVPCGEARGQKARRARAVELLRLGRSPRQIALSVGVSERTVWAYKSQMADQLPAPEQLDLFDRH